MPKGNPINMLGRTDGSLTVICEVIRPPGRWWLVRCACGFEKIESSGHFNSRKRNACGKCQRANVRLLPHLQPFTDDQARARFRLRLDTTIRGDCWMWTGPVNSCGYGAMGGRGRPCTSSRYAWEVFVGAIPVGMQVLHKCDTIGQPNDISYRRCCNPAHMYLGTPKQNHDDKVAHGRDANPPLRKGEDVYGAKLSAAAVQEIFCLRTNGATQRVLAERFSVSRGAIGLVLSGKTWSHVSAKREFAQ